MRGSFQGKFHGTRTQFSAVFDCYAICIQCSQSQMFCLHFSATSMQHLYPIQSGKQFIPSYIGGNDLICSPYNAACRNVKIYVQQGPLFKAGLVQTLHGLKLNPLFYFVYFCTPVYFKTLQKKTPIDPDRISEEISPTL